MPGRFHRLSAEAAIPPFDDWNGALGKMVPVNGDAACKRVNGLVNGKLGI
jgi:hypothetical protein